MDPELALDIKGLKKVYQSGTVAVDGIDLAIPKGEFFGLLGPNGAGKSTTIHCVVGIAKPTEGSIHISGTDVVKDHREARKKAGLAPQEFNFEFFGPVRKTLDYIAGYYGLPKKERTERLDELLERFALTEHADKQFRELSGGLKRRVMLIRAVIHDPELVIFDEPTAGVDVELRHDLWRYMEALNKEGKTVILTSHYLEEIERLCRRIAVINKGVIVAEGSREEFTRNGRLEDTYLKITKGEEW